MASRRKPPATTEPEPPEPWLSLCRLYYALRQQWGAQGRRYGLSFTEFVVIDQCARTRMTATDVARAAGLTPAGATDMIDRLERQRLVTRAAHPSDRRAVLVQLTPRGRRAHRAARTGMRRLARAVRRAMTDTERRSLEVGLRALTRALPIDSG